MSCPYFFPSEPRSRQADSQTALLPLGNLWDGLCRAPGRDCRPDDAALAPLCHLGYARGVCKHVPPDDPGPDAVRFTIRGDDGVLLHLYYVLERDHHPFAHGPIEYSRERAAFTEAPPGPIVARQAEAYVAAYLRSKERAAVSR